MSRIWAGIDAGKTHHHCVVIDADGARLLSRRVANDGPELLRLLADVMAMGEEVTWAIDLPDGGAALVIALLVGHDQQLLYIPGRVVNRASSSYRGEGKTDARDALVIADQARMRRDLNPLRALTPAAPPPRGVGPRLLGAAGVGSSRARAERPAVRRADP
jgi:Transposase